MAALGLEASVRAPKLIWKLAYGRIRESPWGSGGRGMVQLYQMRICEVDHCPQERLPLTASARPRSLGRALISGVSPTSRFVS
jgi:hypothetical protein